MAPRHDLQALLSSILGSSNVYFQPPPSIRIKYPCIVYERDDLSTIRANNKPYAQMTAYQVTIIDADPDSLIPAKVAELPFCEFQNAYSSDNLNHDVYKLFF